MSPQLIIASDSHKIYPGGIVTLRAKDWMGPARASLTSEIDSFASSGWAIRDTQKVTNSIFSAATAAFQEANDTLVIDFSLLSLEEDMTYAVFVSYLIEGDWDNTNSDTYRGATQAIFANTCALAWYGDTVFFLNDTDRAHLKNMVRMRPSYTIGTFPGSIHIGDVVGTEILHWRAYSRTGTTIEWLIDQIILVPYVISGVHGGEWGAGDFNVVSGSLGDFGSQTPTDGDDGGDSNGKFTWHAYPENKETAWSGEDGGGDFQKKSSYASSEYMIHALPDFDALYLANTVPNPDEEASGNAYSLHGARWRSQQTFVNDNFSRTIASNWGVSPQGFGYSHHIGSGHSVSVNGSQGVLHVGGTFGSVGSILNGTSTSARIAAANQIFSGTVIVDSLPINAGTDEMSVAIGFRRPTDVGPGILWKIYVNLMTKQWTLRSDGRTPPDFAGPFDISSWFSLGSPIGFKVEIKRYIIRAKIWDATGAEPGAWDVEIFRPLFSGATWYDYPYTSAPTLLHNIAGVLLSPCAFMSTLDPAGGADWETYWDNFIVEYDPYGTPGDIKAAIEQPHEGIKRGEILIPYGSDYLVHWGSRDWTDFDSFNDGPYLDFSARVWNDVGTAELQRAESPWWYFRSVHGGPIDLSKIRFRGFEHGDI